LRKGKRKQIDNTVKARKALRHLWKKSDLRGRCWGLRRNKSPFAGTNTTIALGDELISISMNPEKQLVIHQFKRVKETRLGTSVKNLLRAKGLPIVE